MIGSSFYRRFPGYNFFQIPRHQTSHSQSSHSQPDFTLSEKTTLQQAMLYRLNSDYNPITSTVDWRKSRTRRNNPPRPLLIRFRCTCSPQSCRRKRRCTRQHYRCENKGRTRSVCRPLHFPVKPGDELETKVWLLVDKEGKQKSRLSNSSRVRERRAWARLR